MWSRSLVAVLLSLPATVAVIGVFLAATPPEPGLRLPSLLMVFPVWVVIASASYLIRRTTTAAAILTAVSLAGFGLIGVLKYAGVGGV